MTDNTNVNHSDQTRFREVYLRKRDTSQFNRRFSEIGIEPQFVQAIRRMLLSEQCQPCYVRDVINNILEKFFMNNKDIIDSIK